LPLQMGLRVIEASSPLTPEARSRMRPLAAEALPWDADVEDAAPFDSPRGVGFDAHPVAAAIRPPPGRVTGGGSALIVDPAQNNAFKAITRALDAGARVSFVPGTAGTEGEPGSSGRYAISGLGGETALVSELALQAARGSAGAAIGQPRVGLYRPWNASMDEGWTRWLLERYGFGFTSLYNPDILAGDLRSRYDVIILADMSSGQIMDGLAKGSVPPRYEGGIGAEGVRELDAFVRGGGTLVTLNRSALFAIETLHLPVENVVAGVPSEEYFQSGSIVEMLVDPSHPVMSGMPDRASVVVERSPVFTTTDGFEGRVFAKYPAEGTPLQSGYLLGPERIAGYASGVEAHHGDGRVLLLGMRPQWRGQPFGNFRILFNAALYSAELAAASPEGEAFWAAPEAEDEDEETGS
ncbi:MAG: hypothetical protein MJB57_06680, partial [Gemmatimonadetes bacterium]|nr:hypothetical protein [Gemmatimonadota bacterium]